MICLAVIKAVKACNLRCPYCYYINSETPSYGAIISEETLRNFYCSVSNYIAPEDVFEFVWHGGEPMLLGKERFRRFIAMQTEYFSASQVHNVIQTNGTLIDPDWIQIFADCDVGVGISLDGPRRVNDRRRPKVSGHGSHDDVIRGLELLRASGHEVGALCVVDPEADGAEVLEHLFNLGFKSCDLLIPITNNALEVATPSRLEDADRRGVSAFLMSAFDKWMDIGPSSFSVDLFDSLIQNAVGLPQGNLNAGSRNFAENIILETDGTICLDPDFWMIDRFQMGEAYRLKQTVNDPDFSLQRLQADLEAFEKQQKLTSLPSECQRCSMRSVCRGSHPASRYGSDGSYDHRSAYCPEMFALSKAVTEYLVEGGLAERLVDRDLRAVLVSETL